MSTTMIPSAAWAQSAPAGEQEGRARFTRGVELYKEGNYPAALAEFNAANAAAPSWKIQYNLGQTLYQLQDYAGALAAFEAYLAGSDGKLDATRKAEVDAEIDKLRQRVATLVLKVSVKGAEILIDNQSKGTIEGPLEIKLSAGRRTLTVTASGYRAATRVLDVAGSTRIELEVPLEPIAAPVAKPREPARTAEQPKMVVRRKSRAPFYVGLVLTGAGVVATTTLGILSLNEHSRHKELSATPNVNPILLSNTRNDLRLLALSTDIVGGVTIGLAAYTIIALALTSGTETVPADKITKKPAESAKSFTVQPTFGFGGAALTGTF